MTTAEGTKSEDVDLWADGEKQVQGGIPFWIFAEFHKHMRYLLLKSPPPQQKKKLLFKIFLYAHLFMVLVIEPWLRVASSIGKYTTTTTKP